MVKRRTVVLLTVTGVVLYSIGMLFYFTQRGRIPNDYYATDFFGNLRNTQEELENFILELRRRYSIDYLMNAFDCSEAAAFLEWALEDAGFDTDIAVGLYSNFPHAWIVVNCEDGKSLVEATTLQIMPTNSHGNYVVTDRFKDVYEAVTAHGNVDEWDWWVVTGFTFPSEIYQTLLVVGIAGGIILTVAVLIKVFSSLVSRLKKQRGEKWMEYYGVESRCELPPLQTSTATFII